MAIIVALLSLTFALLCLASVARVIGARKAADFLAEVRHTAALATALYNAKQADRRAAAVAGLEVVDRLLAARRLAAEDCQAQCLALAEQGERLAERTAFTGEDKARERQAQVEASWARKAASHAMATELALAFEENYPACPTCGDRDPLMCYCALEEQRMFDIDQVWDEDDDYEDVSPAEQARRDELDRAAQWEAYQEAERRAGEAAWQEWLVEQAEVLGDSIPF